MNRYSYKVCISILVITYRCSTLRATLQRRSNCNPTRPMVKWDELDCLSHYMHVIFQFFILSDDIDIYKSSYTVIMMNWCVMCLLVACWANHQRNHSANRYHITVKPIDDIIQDWQEYMSNYYSIHMQLKHLYSTVWVDMTMYGYRQALA